MIQLEIFGALSLVFGAIRYGTYYVSILRGQSRPHLFSWLTWGLITTIVWYGQRVSDAGAGAWATGLIALASFGVCLLAIGHGEREITRSDWVSLILSLLSIPIWLTTADPLWAMAWLTGIDAAAYWPTYRKTWYRPQEEALFSYSFATLRSLCSILAIENLSLTTVIYPAAILTMDCAFIVMALARRAILSKQIAA